MFYWVPADVVSERQHIAASMRDSRVWFESPTLCIGNWLKHMTPLLATTVAVAGRTWRIYS